MVKKTQFIASILFVVIGISACSQSNSSIDAMTMNTDNTLHALDTLGTDTTENTPPIADIIQTENAVVYMLVSAQCFNDGLAWVEVQFADDTRSWAVINTEGRIQFFAKNQPATPFFNGVAHMRDVGIVDRLGNLVIDGNDPRFDYIVRHEGGYTWVSKRIETIDRSETLFGILDNAGEWIHDLSDDWRLVPPNWNTLPNVLGNLIVVSTSPIISDTREMKNYTLVLNIYTLEEVLRAEGIPSATQIEGDSMLLVTNSISSLGFKVNRISVDGIYENISLDMVSLVDEIIGHPLTRQNQVEWIQAHTNLLFSGNNFNLITGTNSNAVYDMQGNKLFEIPQLHSSGGRAGYFRPVFEGDFAFVLLQNESGVQFVTIIDKEGNYLFEPFRGGAVSSGFSGAIERFLGLSEGRVWVRDTEANYILMNTNGETILKMQADNVSEFNEGFAIIQIGRHRYFIDREGNKLTIHS